MSALTVARKLLDDGGEIIALHVYEAPDGSVSAYLDDEVVKAAYEATRKRLHEHVAGQSGVTPVLLKGHASRTIIDFATDKRGRLWWCLALTNPACRTIFWARRLRGWFAHVPCAVHVLRTSG